MRIRMMNKPIQLILNNIFLLLLLVGTGQAYAKGYYVHNDHLGTPKLMTDENQTVVWKANYDPFGKATVDEDPDGDGNTVTMNIRFPGQYYDEETGLHYNYHRYYDPTLGRYITSDPIGLSASINTYAYVSNNPIVKIDPFGLLECLGGEWSTTAIPSVSAFFGGGISLSSTTFTCKSSGKQCTGTTICFGGGPIASLGIGGEPKGAVSGVTDSNALTLYSSGLTGTGGPVSVTATSNSDNVGLFKSIGLGVAFVSCKVLEHTLNCDGDDCPK